MRVLVVEDDTSLREYMCVLLEEYWDVVGVADGLAALDVAAWWAPDLILSDVAMPDLDGHELLQALRSGPAGRTIPVILVSGRARLDQTIEGLGAGADDYIVKPFSAAELVARVRAHLELAQARRRSEHTLQAILDSITDGFMAVDRAGRLTYANDRAAALAGNGHQTLVGKAFEDAFPALNTLESRVCWKEALEGGVPDPLTLRWPATGRWLELRALPAEEGLTILISDVTERTRAEELRREFDHHRDAVMRLVAHDLQGPLITIGWLADLLIDHDDAISRDERREMTGRIARNAQHLSLMARAFLEKGGLADRLLRADRRPTDLAAVLRRVIEAMDVGSHAFHLDVEPVVAEVDPELFERVATNLVGNARTHTPPGTEVFVRLASEAGAVTLVVDDAGPGIPDSLKSQVFVRSRTGRVGTGGTGLGLWIVARVAELHGGRAWVEDRPGGGAAFRVRLAAGVAVP